MGFLLRVVLNGMAIYVAAWLVPGVHLAGPVPTLIAGLILGLVNALVRPILILLTLPFTIVTLGLFLFIVNTICFALDGLGRAGLRDQRVLRRLSWAR